MKPFIERFYNKVNALLGDPHDSTRYTKEQKLEDFYSAEMAIFENLMGMSLTAQLFYYTEAEVAFYPNQYYFKTPPGFRKFLGAERRDSSGAVLARMGSKDFYENIQGLQTMTHGRIMRASPLMVSETEETWTLQYIRQPGLIHYARVADINRDGTSLKGSTPGTDAGDLVLQDDYYNGLFLTVYSSGNGAHPQSMEILKFVAVGPTFILRKALDPIPSGEVWYEISPCILYPLDQIFAVDVALMYLPTRDRGDKAEALLRRRKALWEGAKAQVLQCAADRGSRTLWTRDALNEVPSEVPHGFDVP